MGYVGVVTFNEKSGIPEKQAKKPDTDLITVRLEKDLIAELEAYAEFIDSQKSYVVAQVLATTFGNDIEFQEWRAKNIAPRNGKKPAH